MPKVKCTTLHKSGLLRDIENIVRVVNNLIEECQKRYDNAAFHKRHRALLLPGKVVGEKLDQRRKASRSKLGSRHTTEKN